MNRQAKRHLLCACAQRPNQARPISRLRQNVESPGEQSCALKPKYEQERPWKMPQGQIGHVHSELLRMWLLYLRPSRTTRQAIRKLAKKFSCYEKSMRSPVRHDLGMKSRTIQDKQRLTESTCPRRMERCKFLLNFMKIEEPQHQPCWDLLR